MKIAYLLLCAAHLIAERFPHWKWVAPASYFLMAFDLEDVPLLIEFARAVAMALDQIAGLLC